jgi:hypothetical protein
MNSLTELNSYNTNLSLPFTDSRAADVIFDRLTPTAQTKVTDEGFGFAAPIGIEILEVNNAPISLPVYTIDLFNVVGATVTWATLPAGVTSSTPSTRVFRLNGISSVNDWNTVKAPTINLPANYNGVFTYTSTISYVSAVAGNQSVSWTTTLTITDINFLTSTSDFTYTDGTVQAVSGVTNIVNVDSSYPSATWTIVATPNVNSSITTWTTTGTGGTFSVNGTTKVITITGTRAQVNARLNGLTLSTNTTALDFSLSYAMSNNQDANTETKIQLFKSFDLTLLSSVTAVNYTEDSKNVPLTGYPIITDATRNGLGTYTLTITPSAVGAIEFISNVNAGANDSFNASTKVLTLSGTRSEINARLANLSLWFGSDFVSNFTLSYFVNNPIDIQKTKNQLFQCTSTHSEIANMDVARSYQSGVENLIFASSTPFISDTDNDTTALEYFDPADDVYAITLFSSLGKWSYLENVSPPSESVLFSTLSISGSKATIDGRFSTLRFYPDYGVASNGTFTYTQSKNGVQQVSQSVALNFSGAGTFPAVTLDYMTVGTSNFRPTNAQVTYGKITDLLVVGGGGGGSQGGGGGGQVKTSTNISLSLQDYSIVVGAGGTKTSTSTGDAGSGGSSVAFGITALGGEGGRGANGGGSWSPDGTFNGGGTGPARAFSGPDGGLGGGGAGSGNEPSAPSFPSYWPPAAGGRITYDDYFRFLTEAQGGSSRTLFPGPGINARPRVNSGVNAQLGNGGLGAVITGFFAQGTNYQTTLNTGYGFGGGGGNSYFSTAPSGFSSGFISSADQRFGRGAFYNTNNGSFTDAPDNVGLDGSNNIIALTANIAGGGGGGGSTFRANSAANGIRGIVRIRIGAK